MSTEVKLPRLGQGMESGVVVRWLKKEGDEVVGALAQTDEFHRYTQLALDGDEGKPERQLRLVPQRAFLCRFRKGRRDEFLGLRHSTNLHERVGLADKGHEGHLQFRDSARDLECAFVEVERLLRAAELDVPVPEESEPTYE